MPHNSSLTPRHRKRKERTAAAGTAKSARGTQTFPPTSYLKKQAAQLTTFAPHRLEDIIGGRLQDTTSQITAGVIEEIRRRTGAQLDQLVEELGVDPQHPDKWRRAFQELAAIHHGVGIISWNRPRSPNRNAAGDSSTDGLLYKYVTALKKQGMTRTQAIRAIASDPKKCKKLGVGSNTRSQTPDIVLKAEALRKRLIRIEKRAAPGSLLAVFTGTAPIYGSKEEQAEHTRIMLAMLPDFLRGKSNTLEKP